jgi:AbrB family looped-hinge helix DNA binding protein
MDELITSVTQKGQVTIPKQVRKLLGIRPRDKIRFRIRGGNVQIQRLALTLEEAFGAVQPLTGAGTFEEQVRLAKEAKALRRGSRSTRRP